MSVLSLTRDVVDRLLIQRIRFTITRGLHFVGQPPAPWDSLAWAGTLAGSDRALLAGFAAGYLRGLVKSPPDQIQVLLPYEKVVDRDGPWLFTRTRNLRNRRVPPMGIEPILERV